METEKEKLLAELGLSWSVMTHSEGLSATSKMDIIIRRLTDPSSSSQTQLSICSALISWQSVASKDEIEDAMVQHSDAIFGYIGLIVKSGGDANSNPPDLQTPAYYLTSCIHRQMRNAKSTSFPIKMVPKVLKTIRLLAESKICLQEKLANSVESNISSRTETIRLLVKCIPSDDNDIASEGIATFFLLLKLLSHTITPALRREVMVWLVAVGQRDKLLFNSHIADLVGAMRFGEADELTFLLKENDDLFIEVAPEVLEHNVHFLVTTLGFPSLSKALLLIARSDAGAGKLSGSVVSLIKDISGIQTAGTLPSLIAILLRIATVRPELVSRHMAACTEACLGSLDGDQALDSDIVTNEKPQIMTLPEKATSVLLVTLIMLLAAVSVAGAEETTASLTTLTKLVNLGKARTITEQSALLGAIDVAKNKHPDGNIFTSESMACLALISSSNRASYSNIIKWNGGRWAAETDLAEYIETVDNMIRADMDFSSCSHIDVNNGSYLGTLSNLLRSKRLAGSGKLFSSPGKASPTSHSLLSRDPEARIQAGSSPSSRNASASSKRVPVVPFARSTSVSSKRASFKRVSAREITPVHSSHFVSNTSVCKLANSRDVAEENQYTVANYFLRLACCITAASRTTPAGSKITPIVV